MSMGTEYQSECDTTTQSAPRRTGLPYHRSSVFTDAGIRNLVAAACEDQITALQSDPEHLSATARAGRDYVMSQLDEVINELRGVQ